MPCASETTRHASRSTLCNVPAGNLKELLIMHIKTTKPALRLAALALLLAPMLSFPAQPVGAAPAIAPVNVPMRNAQFTATALNVPVGTTVTWSNEDPFSHNIAIIGGPQLWVSPERKQGQSTSFTFTKPGKYTYYCEFHPGMEAAIVVGNSNVQSPPSYLTFKETAKTVRGSFLDYWRGHGGLAQQGFPISEEMAERSDTDGKVYTVQYFERAVFEQHPENAAPYDVLLSLLGTFNYKQKYPNGAPKQTPNTAAGSQLFKETNHRVGGRFLEYWQKNGGLAQQGFP